MMSVKIDSYCKNKMDSIFFSLIVPVYNVQSFLEKCLSSICNQSYKNWEAIIVDDGSSDSSSLICDEWGKKDKRLKIYHKKNEGVCLARNFALSKCQGQYIGFVDADDYLESDALELVFDAIKQNQFDAVFIGHKRVDEFDNIKEIRLGEELILKGKTDIVRQTLLLKNGYLGVLWNKFIRSECIYDGKNIINFDKSFAIGEDQVWLLNVFNNVETAITVNKPLYAYRIRGNSVVHSQIWDERKMSEFYARNKMVELTEKFYPELTKYACIKYRNCVNAIGLNLIRTKSFKVLKSVSDYCKLYFRDFAADKSVSMKNKTLSLLLQIVYLFF